MDQLFVYKSLLGMFYGSQQPPPPQGPHNPLEVPVEWYVDVPTSALGLVFGAIPGIQQKFFTSISVVSGGDQMNPWARLQVFGKPLGIHKSIVALKDITHVNEAGYVMDAVYPNDDDADVIAKSMPVYHGAWTEFCSRR